MRKRLAKGLLDLHLYLGLLSAPYLVVYGVSAIAFNHGWEGTPGKTTSWEAAVADIPASADDASRADALRGMLGLEGRIPPRSVKGLDDGLRFDVLRPGRSFRVHLAQGERWAHVEETHTGLLDVLRGIHGSWGIEGSTLGTVWRVYTEYSVWALVFSVVSGVLLWSQRGDWLGWAFLIAGGAAFTALSAAVW